jgi:hypothetical protein
MVVARSASRAGSAVNRGRGGAVRGGRGRGGRSGTGNAAARPAKDEDAEVAALNRELDIHMGRDPNQSSKEYELAKLDKELDTYHLQS